METLPEFLVAGIPLVVIVFALVAEVKAWGLTGKALRGVSVGIGVLLSVGYQFAFQGLPATPAGWYTAIVIGILFGLSASGAYDFLNKRFPEKA